LAELLKELWMGFMKFGEDLCSGIREPA